jgi:hypothetical protein
MNDLKTIPIIDQKLDSFFERLQHTPGKWVYNGDTENVSTEDRKLLLASIYRYDRAGDKIHGTPFNGFLMANAPALLRTVCHTYLWNLVYMPMIIRSTVGGQMFLAGLLHSIVEAVDPTGNGLGVTSQEIQDTFEKYSQEVKIHNAARSFSLNLDMAIGREKLIAAAIENNKRKHDTCASQDYCDANMVMLETFVQVGFAKNEDQFIDVALSSLDDSRLTEKWNAVWYEAKRHNFFLEDKDLLTKA